jgi:N-acetylneuraminic acid mutarotase
MSIYGQALGNKGYLCSPASNLMYMFDPTDDSFEQLNTSAPFDLNRGMGETVCRDTFYLVAGYGYGYTSISKDIYKYDESINDWKVAFDLNFSRLMPVAFSLSNKLFFGLNRDNYSNKLMYEYNPLNNTVTQVAKFPGTIQGFAGWFSLNNKGYVLLGDNTFWEFDPALNQWTQKNNFTGPSRTRAASFVLEGSGYIGAGESGYSERLGDIWKYDLASDTWTKVTTMPGERFSPVALVINNKLYIGYGVNSYGQLYDFYEYDPDYTW